MRFFLLQTPVDVLGFDETIRLALNAMTHRQPCIHVALNAAKLVRMRSNADLRTDVAGADIIGIDGKAIVWALRLLGGPAADRVAGVDLMMGLLDECARSGMRPFILGARQHILERAAKNAKNRWPELKFAGLAHGYFPPQDETAVVEMIRQSRADCLFVAMPTPRKEQFLAAHARRMDVPFIMGVGGSVDVLAGQVRRAPVWMQNTGMEWLFRLIREPRRMFWRYASTNAHYILLVVAALVRGERATRARTD
ncbi:MAG: WecB/TagA/CpsF family glycosyltransferase [Sphingomonadaceae bacterium]